jgi:glycyl-tRNA synthetase beta chain
VNHTLLFEVGTEELPPSELPTVLAALGERGHRALAEARLAFRSLEVYSTPRRLALLVSGLVERQASRRSTVTGPPKTAAFDAAGKPTRAADGFARSQGVRVDQLRTIDTDRGEYVAVDKEEPGRAAADVLPEVLVELVASLPFEKQMRWGVGDVRFSRPVRWLVAMLDEDVLPVSFAGVTAGRITYGHRFLHPAPITLLHPEEYVGRLESAEVIPDVEKRRHAVLDVVEAAAKAHGYRAVIDPPTLETVVHLVESPAALVGTFPPEYLDLPYEVIETPIRHHQKCFVVHDGKSDSLTSAFVGVSNMPGTDQTNIRRGYERVVRARLADAKFYFDEDRKIRLEERLALLEKMVFQERLGTLKEKTDRLVMLTAYLARGASTVRANDLGRAALLCKCDLASGMVREFPELQGIMGATYSRYDKEAVAVSRAIHEHYRPRFADDDTPGSLEGALLSTADKLDTVVGIIGIGLMPSGSQDPYALRRQAQGVIQIALDFGDRFRLSLEEAVQQALELLAAKLTEPSGRVRERVLEFFRGRLATILVGRGYRADVVDAVVAGGFYDPSDVRRRVDALTALLRQPDWEPLVVTFKRTINILPERTSPSVVPPPLVDEAEHALYAETEQIAPEVRAATTRGEYETALTLLARLRPAVDRFFDAVMVMDKDPAVRDRRLGLLRAIADLLLPIADLRKVQAGP